MFFKQYIYINCLKLYIVDMDKMKVMKYTIPNQIQIYIFGLESITVRSASFNIKSHALILFKIINC